MATNCFAAFELLPKPAWLHADQPGRFEDRSVGDDARFLKRVTYPPGPLMLPDFAL